MRTFAALVVLSFLIGVSPAQQTNGPFHALNIDGPASPPRAIPIIENTLTDTKVDLNLRAFPGVSPFVLLFATSTFSGGSIQAGALTGFGFSIDLPDQLPAGYADQMFLNGFQSFNPLAYTSATGDASVPNTIPACVISNNVPTCITASSFEISGQAIVIDPTAPFGVSSTAAGTARFTLGYQEYSLFDNGFGIFNFLGGFTFRFYGTSYTRAFVSDNGYISFSTPPAGFQMTDVATLLNGPPRIMSWNEDLAPQFALPGQRIYAQQFVELGVRKVRFVHQRLAEFNNTTGPHGGEIVITENDEIAVLTAPYNATPSSNTAVGITPGNGVDTVAAQATAFGRDLTVDFAAAPTALGMGGAGFEVFDHTTPSVLNPIDLIALGFFNANGVGPGIVYTLDPTTPNLTPADTGYVIQPPGFPAPPPSCQ